MVLHFCGFMPQEIQSKRWSEVLINFEEYEALKGPFSQAIKVTYTYLSLQISLFVVLWMAFQVLQVYSELIGNDFC
jgi:predicted DNA-binding protein (UPF0251 family)